MGYSKLLVLDSSDVYNLSNPNVTGKGYSDFTVLFNRPLEIPKGCQCAMIKLNTYYTWSIVSTANKNNTFQIISTTPAKTVNAVLPNGIYSLTSLNEFLLSLFAAEFGYTGDTLDMPIAFAANQATSRFVIRVNNSNYSINLSPLGSLFYTLIGWDLKSQPMIVNTTTTAANVGNINFNIDNYLLHCDLVHSSVINNDVSNSVIYAFVPQVEIGEAILEQPIAKMYLPIEDQDIIKSIRLYLTDNRQRYVDLQEPMVVTLHLTDSKTD